MKRNKPAARPLSAEEDAILEELFGHGEPVVSATECTGLVPTPPRSAEQSEAYAGLYDILNPNGDLPETGKHPK